MSQPCTYKFGEFAVEEFPSEEFFTGYPDCSVEDSVVVCDNLLIHARPFTRSQRELDYQLLWNYVRKDLETSATSIFNKTEIGIFDDLAIEFNTHTSYFISLLLLFKEQLKAKKDAVDKGEGTDTEKAKAILDIYASMFHAYMISCINANFRARYKKPKYVKDMFKLLNIQELVNISLLNYQVNTDYNSDPIYYIADLT
jgi:hypothetical protein